MIKWFSLINYINEVIYYSVWIIILQVDILIIFFFPSSFPNHVILNTFTCKRYMIVHEGWKWKTPYIQVYMVINQVFFYRSNEPKIDLTQTEK